MTPVTLATINSNYLIFGGAGLVSLIAYIALILVPAISSFGRPMEKVAAGFLTLFVLATLVLAGVAIGVLILYKYDDLSNIF